MNELSDREHIKQLLYLYSHYMDAGKNHLVATHIYCDDGSVDAGLGFVIEGRDAITDFYTSSPYIPFKGVNTGAVCHMMSNVIVQIDGDTARSNARVLCFFWPKEQLTTAPKAAESVLLGAYEDQHRRTAEGWRISHRRVCSFGTSVAAGAAPPYMETLINGVVARQPEWPPLDGS